jgi:hypothetical protein
VVIETMIVTRTEGTEIRRRKNKRNEVFFASIEQLINEIFKSNVTVMQLTLCGG